MMPAMMNILALMFLIIFIFSVLGTFLFNNITNGEVLNDTNVNFIHFGNAFILLFDF